MRTVVGWLISYLFRWLPAPTRTGLFCIGAPDRNSPVLVTTNFWLTVRRLRKALHAENAWLLVVNSGGINVWCASTGGLLTHSQVTDAVKVSRLAEAVDHRRLVLPALAAPGVDADRVQADTGFTVSFGPVRAEDAPDYLRTGAKTKDQERFRFDIRHRADMFFAMNFPVYLPVAAVLGIFWPAHLPLYTLLFWGSLAFLYLFIGLIPGRSGWTQAVVAAATCAAGWAAVEWIVTGNPLGHWPWLIALFGIFVLAGIDLAGTASARRSDFEVLLHRLGRRRAGRHMTERNLGYVHLNEEDCISCGRCRDLCPLGVFGEPRADGKSSVSDGDACFACGACVLQCPAGALSLAP